MKVGRVETFALTVMSLPARGLAWVTGWSTGAVAMDLSRLHGMLLVLLFVHDRTLFSLPWAPVAFIAVIVWTYDGFADVRVFRVLDEWRAGEDDVVPPRVLEAWLYVRRWFRIIGVCWFVALLVPPTGLGELVWAVKPMAYAGALYGGGPGTSVTARARAWAARRRTPRFG